MKTSFIVLILLLSFNLHAKDISYLLLDKSIKLLHTPEDKDKDKDKGIIIIPKSAGHGKYKFVDPTENPLVLALTGTEGSFLLKVILSDSGKPVSVFETSFSV